MSDSFGLDTSVIVRLLSGEPPELAESALRWLQEQAAADRECFVSDLVVAEAYFALHHHYDVPKEEAVASLISFLKSPGIVARGEALKTLEQTAGATSKPGFVDRLIQAQYNPARLVSCEKAASRLPNCVLLR